MRFARVCAEISLLLSLVCFAGSCGNEKGMSKDAQAWERLTASAIKLYSELQPLRSARLGIVSSDSLLFTFSDNEIKSAIERLKMLESQFSTLSASRLPERDIDEATVVIHWLRGELFALETLENQRCSPLLYCWMAEEALWGMPARFTPPYDGELDAYRKRILRIPSLLANGERHLKNPAEAHVRYAIERLDSLAGGIDGLEVSVEKRYGAALDGELDLVRESLVDFRRFAYELLPVSHGTLILGAENLSRLFLYDELLNSDPNMLMAEAEKQIKRFAGERSSTERRLELEKQRSLAPPGTPERKRIDAAEAAASARRAAESKDAHGATQRKGAGKTASGSMESLESRVERLSLDLWTGNEEGTGIQTKDRVRPILEYPAKVEYLSPLDKDPYLSVPPVGERTAAAVFTPPFSVPTCRPYLFLSSENAKADDAELSFRLFSTAPEILELGEVRCQKKDTLAVLFSSETFEEGWRYLSLLERMRDIKKNNPALHTILMDERVKQLARMIVVFRLHTGVSTSEEAVRYLAETIGMKRDVASREVLLASVAPSVAYPGISMILIEEMLRNAAYVYGYANPTRDLKKLLLESRDVPLALILPKTKSK